MNYDDVCGCGLGSGLLVRSTHDQEACYSLNLFLFRVAVSDLPEGTNARWTVLSIATGAGKAREGR